MTDEPIRPLDALERTILARQAAPNDQSYTTKLLAGGLEMMGGKVIEEAAEVVEAAGQLDQTGRKQTTYEAADLIYHLMVMLAACGVRLEDVEAELASRFGVSGLEEKARRSEK